MSNKNNNTKNDEIKYFSTPHPESGFIRALTLVENSHGEDYYAMKVNVNRGNSKNPKKTLFSVRITGNQSKEVIGKHADKIIAQLKANKKLWDEKKSDQSVSIFVGFNVSDTEAKSYTNKHNQQLVNYIDGRCTSVAYLKLGDEVLFNKNDDANSATTDTDENQPVAEDADSNVPFYVDENTGEMLDSIQLSKEDPEFKSKYQALKDAGYTWDKNNMCWRTPVAA